MTNINTMGKTGYVVWNVLFMLLLFLGFALNSQPDHKVESISFYSATIILTAIGVAITFQKRRNWVSLITNIASGPLVYFCFIFLTYRVLRATVCGYIIVSLVLAGVYMILVLQRKDSRFAGCSVPLKKRITHGLLGARTVFVWSIYIVQIAIWLWLLLHTVVKAYVA